MKISLLALSVLLSAVSFGQLKGTIGDQYSHFQLKHKKDTIDFVVADTALTKTKPVLLFCQGSQPIPLFFDFPSQGIIPVTLSNFDVNEMKKDFHLVVISMPKTPVVVGPDHLNRSYCYVQDPTIEHSYDPEYLEGDFLQNYVDRANKVIKYLIKQKWVDKSQIMVAGHSQGARVAVGIAHSNKNVTKVGLFGYNPQRRIDQMVWTYRKQAEYGNISWEQADSLQQKQYEFYRTVLNTDSVDANPSLKSWQSFSTSSIEQLTDLNIPVYIAFGSEDGVADYCDLLPLDFAEKQKTDYVIKRYPNMEHNFFPLREDGKPDYENGQWNNVMKAFLNWSKE